MRSILRETSLACRWEVLIIHRVQTRPQPKAKRSIRFSAARRKAVAAWRGIDLTPVEFAKASTAKAAATVMPAVLEALGLDRRRLEAEIGKVWNHSLDPSLVAHAQPKGIHKGTLFVNVDSNVWLHEIVRYRRKEILERLQHSFGAEFIQRISFRVG